jgi:hypothetical protein
MEQLKQRDKPPKTKRKFCPKKVSLTVSLIAVNVIDYRQVTVKSSSTRTSNVSVQQE